LHCMLAASTFRPTTRTLRLPFSRRARIQIGLFLIAYAVYTIARFFTIGDLADATANAHWIVDLQNAVGVGVEASVQNALDGSWVMWVLNRLYLAAQLGVIPAVLIFLYNRSWKIYATLRNTILATWLISVPVYGLFPVAPPRLSGIGIEDTITSQTSMSLTSNFSTSFFNELAAVPSLHVGFAVAVGFALFAVLKNPVLKWAALLWGPIVGLAVVATGNHFFFDAVAGLAAAAAGYGFVLIAARMRVKRPTRGSLGAAFAEA
jgi:PAP2 superfamily